MIKNDLCVVFLCNKPYFNKFIYTCNQLITNGKYNGNICLVVGDDLNNDKFYEIFSKKVIPLVLSQQNLTFIKVFDRCSFF
jgi:hypothetical protein